MRLRIALAALLVLCAPLAPLRAQRVSEIVFGNARHVMAPAGKGQNAPPVDCVLCPMPSRADQGKGKVTGTTMGRYREIL